MARRTSSFGFLGRFGRSGDLRQLDGAFRGAGLHPALVPEGAKLAVVNLMKDHLGNEPAAEAYPPIGELMACCALGSDIFAQENGPDRLDAVTGRIEDAISLGEGLDADLLLLALHAGLVHPDLVARFGLEAVQR